MAMRKNPMEASSDREQGFQPSFTSQAALPQFRKPTPQWSLSSVKCIIVRQFIFRVFRSAMNSTCVQINA